MASSKRERMLRPSVDVDTTLTSQLKLTCGPPLVTSNLRRFQPSQARIVSESGITSGLHLLGMLHEAQRRRIHAVAEMRGLGAVVENVAQVGIAFGTGNRGANHAMCGIADLAKDFRLVPGGGICSCHSQGHREGLVRARRRYGGVVADTGSWRNIDFGRWL